MNDSNASLNCKASSRRWGSPFLVSPCLIPGPLTKMGAAQGSQARDDSYSDGVAGQQAIRKNDTFEASTWSHSYDSAFEEIIGFRIRSICPCG